MRRMQSILPLTLLLAMATAGCSGRNVAASESGLRSNLKTLRELISTYREAQGRYPHALEDLVEAGYVRKLPFDPITQRNDSWIESREAGEGTNAGGIVNVHSGASGIAADGTRYAHW